MPQHARHAIGRAVALAHVVEAARAQEALVAEVAEAHEPAAVAVVGPQLRMFQAVRIQSLRRRRRLARSSPAAAATAGRRRRWWLFVDVAVL